MNDVTYAIAAPDCPKSRLYIRFNESIPIGFVKMIRKSRRRVEYIISYFGLLESAFDEMVLVDKDELLLLVAREKNENTRAGLKSLLKEML